VSKINTRLDLRWFFSHRKGLLVENSFRERILRPGLRLDGEVQEPGFASQVQLEQEMADEEILEKIVKGRTFRDLKEFILLLAVMLDFQWESGDAGLLYMDGRLNLFYVETEGEVLGVSAHRSRHLKDTWGLKAFKPSTFAFHAGHQVFLAETATED